MRLAPVAIPVLLLPLLLASRLVAEDDDDRYAAAESQVRNQLDALDRLPELTPCLKAVRIALKDASVRRLFLSKMINPCYRLKDICCLDIPHVPERELVLFNFDCKPHCFCLVDPQFLVVVDRHQQTVVATNDPYMGPTKPCRSILGSALETKDETDMEGASATTLLIEGVVSGCDVIRNGNNFRMFAFITDPSTGSEIQITSRIAAFQRVLLAASDMRQANLNNKKPLVEVEYTTGTPHYVQRIRVLDR